MRKINNIIFNIGLCLMAAAVSVSCLAEKDGPSARQQNVMMEINVSVGAMTKADLTSSEEQIKSLRVYAFHGERLAGYAGWTESVPANKLYMDLVLPESGIADLTFYAIANEGQMSYENGVLQLADNMTKAQLEAIRYTGLESDVCLPMYYKGTHSINAGAVTTAQDGHYVLTDKVNIRLERSLAKISVYTAAASQGFELQINTIKLLAGGTRIYSHLFPQSKEVLMGMASRVEARVLHSSEVEVSKVVLSGTPAADLPENYDEVMTGQYLPEVPYKAVAGAANEKAAVLYVEYGIGTDQKQVQHGYVYLPEIVRNTHYKVCIIVKAEGQILVNIDVAPWVDAEDTERDIDYPTHSYIMNQVPVEGRPYPEAPALQATMSESSAFTGYFQMTYPASEKWTPTLTGNYAAVNDVEVYEYKPSGDYLPQDKLPFPISASDKWYTIKVIPHDDMPISETVQLAISYTGGGFTEAEFLLINGSAKEYYWPGSQDCNYITITMVN